MLTSIFLEQFKCFEKLALPLAPLTLLTGLNASGKSTVLQALAVLHQTLTDNEWNNHLLLNHSAVSLGSVGDVINQISGRREFVIGLNTKEFGCQWKMEAEDRSALLVPIREVLPMMASLSLEEINEPIQYLLPKQFVEPARTLINILANMTYLSADRLGPRETYPVGIPKQHNNVGSHGELTPWVLYYYADKRPLDNLLRSDTPPTLTRQVEAWMQIFFPGINLQVEPIRGANLMTLGIRTNQATDFHRPQNVGYGLSHVLPILTACLVANQGDLIVIESPESHLHPSGQSAMGEFLSLVAASGVQIILETHSDHILNGVRRAIKKNMDSNNTKNLLQNTDTLIHFFMRQSDNDNEPRIASPLINSQGNLDYWPEGFFDQIDKDTAFLLGW